MNFTSIAALITEVCIMLGAVIPLMLSHKKEVKGRKCLLRSEMLRTYYHCKESGKIRQFEFENFIMLYEAYKELKGNSFIDKIYEEVKELEIIT